MTADRLASFLDAINTELRPGAATIAGYDPETLPEREPGGVAQEPGAQPTSADALRQSTGLETPRTENAGVIAPPAGSLSDSADEADT